MSRLSRRDFARTVGVAAGAVLLPARAVADDRTKPKPSSASSAPSAAAAPSKLSAASLAEADARVTAIVARYGARLSPAERADLTRLSRDAQQQLDTLRAYPLEPTDEPAHVFRAPRRRR